MVLKDETRRPRALFVESWVCGDGLTSFDRMTVRGWGVERISIRTLVERGEWAEDAAFCLDALDFVVSSISLLTGLRPSMSQCRGGTYTSRVDSES